MEEKFSTNNEELGAITCRLRNPPYLIRRGGSMKFRRSSWKPASSNTRDQLNSGESNSDCGIEQQSTTTVNEEEWAVGLDWGNGESNFFERLKKLRRETEKVLRRFVLTFHSN